MLIIQECLKNIPELPLHITGLLWEANFVQATFQ
jgi:hypothetical protein